MRTREKGMTLLEVVVSMLIIGLGIVMCISMMQASNRYGETAEYRATAINEIQSVVDRIRANSLGIDGYVWGKDGYQNTGYNINSVKEKKVSPLTCGKKCTTQQNLEHQAKGLAYTRAKADMEDWLGHVKTALPGGQAMIAKDGKNQYKVKVMWRANPEAEDTSAKSDEFVELTFAL